MAQILRIKQQRLSHAFEAVVTRLLQFTVLCASNLVDRLIQKLCHGKNGDRSIDNDVSERAMRPVAIGRKDWMFVGNKTAGSRAAILMSLIASCKTNPVDP
jgi:hypothetical protein